MYAIQNTVRVFSKFESFERFQISQINKDVFIFASLVLESLLQMIVKHN